MELARTQPVTCAAARARSPVPVGGGGASARSAAGGDRPPMAVPVAGRALSRACASVAEELARPRVRSGAAAELPHARTSGAAELPQTRAFGGGVRGTARRQSLVARPAWCQGELIVARRARRKRDEWGHSI
ncbi:hypothetical protein C2845_PM09G13690 [Panicum miliaceum]|uniref:Uncharacterized protein n=1 Tax=Panicum miliaceum TaxID=4540 RepID=A0A3L6RZX7_PANMI|nr:hypothetical protein C2845_PM09G13690 [Panicum miliaceum]